MSEIKITQSSLENGIFRDGQIVSGYVSDNSEIKSSDKGAHAEGYATSDSSIISSGLGSIAAGFADECGTIKSNSRGSIAIGCADGDGSEYSLISANEKGAIAIGSANNNSSINAFGVGSIALGYSSHTASISSNGFGAIAYGFSTNNGIIDSSGMGTTAEGYSTGNGAQIKAIGHGATAKGFAEGENSHIIASGKGSYAEGWAYNGGKLIALGDGSHAEGKSSLVIDNSPFESITLQGQSYRSTPSLISDYNAFMVVPSETENTPSITTYSNIRCGQQYVQIKQNTLLNPGRVFTITYQQQIQTDTYTYQYRCNQNQSGITIYLINGQHINTNDDQHTIKNVTYNATSTTPYFTFELDSDIRTTTNDVDVTVLEQSFYTTSSLSTGSLISFNAILYNDNTKYEFSGAQDSVKYISNIDIVPDVGTIVVYNYENNYNIAKTTKVEYINTFGKTIQIVSISNNIIQITKQEDEQNDYFDNLKIGQIIIADTWSLTGTSYAKILNISSPDEQTKNLTVSNSLNITRGDTCNIESYYEITLDHTLSTITNLNNQIITSKFCGAIGEQSHIEGHNNEAYGNQSHAEGLNTCANGQGAHAEGVYTNALGNGSHAEGYKSNATNAYSHAEGYYTTASGNQSHAEGNSTIASGISSHAEGLKTQAISGWSHAEGDTTLASGTTSHAEGSYTQSLGAYSHAEGDHTRAKGNCSHAEGYGSLIRSTFQYIWRNGENSAISEDQDQIYMDTYIKPGTFIYYGQNDEEPEEQYITEIVSVDNTTTSFTIKDTFKFSSQDYIYFFIGANNNYSHSEGYNTAALATASHAAGMGTLAIYTSQTVVGRYNNGIENALFVVGNGLNIANRNNALVIYVDGRIERTVTPIFPGESTKPWALIDSEYDGYAYGEKAAQHSYLIWDNVIWAFGASDIQTSKEILYIQKYYTNILLRWGDGDANLVFSSNVYKPRTKIKIKIAKGFGVHLHGYNGSIGGYTSLGGQKTYEIQFGDDEYSTTFSTSLSGYKIRQIASVSEL